MFENLTIQDVAGYSGKSNTMLAILHNSSRYRRFQTIRATDEVSVQCERGARPCRVLRALRHMRCQ